MKGQASNHDAALQSAMASAGFKRLQRKRTYPDRDKDKYIANIKSKRRRKRVGTDKKDPAELKADNIPYASDIDSESSTDSEAKDENYIPEEVSSRKRKGKKRKTDMKRGQSQSTLTDGDDLFAEEYEFLTERYQFALDLKEKDHGPGTSFLLCVKSFYLRISFRSS